MEGAGQKRRPLVVMASSTAAARGGANPLVELGDRFRSLEAGGCASSSSSSSAVGSALGGSHARLAFAALAATAMALSGTLILFSIFRAKPHYHLVASSSGDSTAAATSTPSPARLRPCLSSSSGEKEPRSCPG